MSKLVQCQDGMALKDGIVLYRMAKPVARYIAELERRIAELEQPWVSVEERLPSDGEKVLCRYAGVYENRICGFWTDAGGNPHFGEPNEPDSKGSQPVTHWMPLPTPPEEQEG